MTTPAQILFLASTPDNVDRLALDEEAREIQKKIHESAYRDGLILLTRWAVRPDDLLLELNANQPSVVHFSGHGSKAGQIVLMNDARRPVAVEAATLVRLFRTLKGNIKVVLLNACYSKTQAEAIRQVVDCVIGMSTAISDQAAIAFSASFYRALGFGRSVQQAYEQGLVAIALGGYNETATPELLSREGIDPRSVFLTVAQREGDELLRVAAETMNELPLLTVVLRPTASTSHRLSVATLEAEALQRQRRACFPPYVLDRYPKRTTAGLIWTSGSSGDSFCLSPDHSLTATRFVSCGASLFETNGHSSSPGRPKPAVSALHCLLLPLGLLRFFFVGEGTAAASVNMKITLEGVQGRLLSFEAMDQVLRPGPTWNLRFWNHDSSPCLERGIAVERDLWISRSGNVVNSAVVDLFSEVAYYFSFRVQDDSLSHTPQQLRDLCGELASWLDRGADEYKLIPTS